MEGLWGRALAAAASGDRIAEAWAAVRARAVAPALEAAVWVCLAMSVMLVLEVCYMSIVSFVAVKLLRRVPERRYKWEPMPAVVGGGGSGKDEEAAVGGGEAFPMVLVQIPMYNEMEVYKLSIAAACALTWPPDRIIIQVLDDSTDPFIKELVELECKDWAGKKINIKYEIRESRKGYKAGALKKGMEHSYAQECDFVAIFDADFRPEPDFLLRTVPFLVHNPKIALVQTRWEFGKQAFHLLSIMMFLTWHLLGNFAVNYDVCLMTRIQKMSLDYHFKVEQESGSSMHAFFGFNGTAGVWRASAISEAGGWKDRTTVEDMDLAVRASILGWQFLYVGDVKSELPSTLKAYRHQQHRWTCGAANLFRKMAPDIGVSVWKKFHLLYSFFFVRRVIAPMLTFLFYCIVIPLSVMVPEVSIPVWGMFYIPTVITIMNAIRNPWSIHLVPIWILFENVMSMHRMRAALTGLLETMYVDEWVVTEKVGDHVKDKLEVPLLTPVKPTECVERIYVPEILVAFYLLVCASYDFVLGAGHYYLYIFLQAFAFLVLGFGFVGTATPCSCP
ncbi:putative mannan synthase 4 [Dichanthelium oligosanthes]|uniref:glucomannan 4-beta-mannosyltransferase n=1 Tax=Dichanthelium oligosanthes TaxID=888268 RepID=A0A1E5VWB8_9POAL|nr:putative mannan synthase 4 [Dichanthelium oligosanthes]